MLWCWQKKNTGNTRRLIEKHIHSSNRHKIQVNLVRQWLVNRKLRVQRGSDNPSTSQVVSHEIVSRGSGQRYWLRAPPNGQVRHKAFLKVGPGVWPEPTRARHFQKYLGPCRHSPKEGRLRRQAINLTPPKKVKAWGTDPCGQRDLQCRGAPGHIRATDKQSFTKRFA